MTRRCFFSHPRSELQLPRSKLLSLLMMVLIMMKFPTTTTTTVVVFVGATPLVTNGVVIDSSNGGKESKNKKKKKKKRAKKMQMQPTMLPTEKKQEQPSSLLPSLQPSVPPAVGYPLVNVVNWTTYRHVHGIVKYTDPIAPFGFRFCTDDHFEFHYSEGASWEASTRGGCLVSKIIAVVTNEDGDFYYVPGNKKIHCEPYLSSGTGYSQFAVAMRDWGCSVVRRCGDHSC